jgi:hypothetical protein
LVQITEVGTEIIKTIVTWEHPNGDAHCLGRVFKQPNRNPVAILSELRTNPLHRDMGSEPEKAAEALLKVPEVGVNNSPETIVWLLHYGAFSYYEGGGSETFTLAPLRWDGMHYHVSLADCELLTPQQMQDIISPAQPEPVPQVLQELDWPY